MELRLIVKWGAFAIIGYVMLMVIGPPYKAAYDGQKTLAKLASDSSTNTSMAQITAKAVEELHRLGLKDVVAPEHISVSREEGKWIIGADYTARRKIYKMVHMEFEFSIASDRTSLIPESAQDTVKMGAQDAAKVGS